MTLKYYPIHFNSFGEIHIKIISFDLNRVQLITSESYRIKLDDRIETFNYSNTEDLKAGFVVKYNDIFDTLEEAQEALIKKVFK